MWKRGVRGLQYKVSARQKEEFDQEDISKSRDEHL